MFYVFLFLNILIGIGLGAWLSMKHGEEYRRWVMLTKNSSLVVIENGPDALYDTESVNEFDQNLEENPEISESVHESVLVVEENGENDEETENRENDEPLSVIESTMPEMKSPLESQAVSESLDEIADQSVVPQDDSLPKPLENPEDQGVLMSDAKSEIGEGTGVVSEPAGTTEQFFEFPADWLSAEVIEELVQMVNLSTEPSPEIRVIVEILQEIQNILTPDLHFLLNQVDAEFMLTGNEAKYLSRVICRPKIGGKPQKA